MDNKYYKLDLEDLEDLEDLGDSGKITVEKRRKNGVVEKRQVKFKPLRFTKKNRDLILACIDIDSTYRRSFDEENPNSSAHYIVEWFGDKNKYENEYLKKSREEKIKIMFEVCYRLDKENSTHLSVSSSTKGENANKGVELMASAIVDKCVDKEGKSNILKALETDTEGKIVYNISQFVSYQNKKNEDGNDKIRNNLSFASKFCTFMCRYAFDETDENHDKFSIYDSVLCNILPYYMWKYQKYLDEDKKLTKNMLTKDGKNSVANLTKDKGKGYRWYNDIISSILNGIKGEEKLEISREEFDLMLWYYYKGDNDLIDASYVYIKDKLNKL